MAHRSRTHRTSPPKKTFRADIQGLRALAVVAVVLDHGLNWPDGGFVGVDVFFVISGFLITGLLLREREETGRISFRGFYARRVRRILPGALFVLISVVVLAAVLFPRPRAAATFFDALAAGTFWANWHFALIGTDYFSAGGAVSPVQHFWSLSVEEQFYAVWPVVLLGGFWTASRLARTGRVSRLIIGAPLAILTVASFIWASWESISNPTFAYFSTASRAWELGAGALLALAVPTVSKIPRAARVALGWLGFACILAGMALITGASGFPAPLGLLPVLGALAVIASGLNSNDTFLKPLTNPVSVYVGEISYSLYLWHYPVLIFVAALFPTGGIPYAIAIGALILALAIASYHFVEEPFRRFRPDVHRMRRRKRRPSRQQALDRRRATLPVLGVLLLLALTAVCLNVVRSQTLASTAAAEQLPNESVIRAATTTSSKAENARAAALLTALSSTTWPQFSPTIESLGSHGYVSEWVRDGCLDVRGDRISRCVYGDRSGKKLAVVVGDSHAISYMPAYRRALPSDWRIQSLTLEQCPAADVSVTKVGAADSTSGAGAPYPECIRHRKLVLDWLKAHHPDLILWTDAAHLPRISGSDAPAKIAALKRGALETARAFAALSDQVVLVPGPPDIGNLVSCKTAVSTPANCVANVSDEYRSFQEAERSALTEADEPNVHSIATLNWFCVGSRCPAFVGAVPMTTDGNHLIDQSSAGLAPLMKEALTPYL